MVKTTTSMTKIIAVANNQVLSFLRRTWEDRLLIMVTIVDGYHGKLRTPKYDGVRFPRC
jgi:hypothetical protein